MKRIIGVFSLVLACAVAMSSACAAAENNKSSADSPIVVAQAKQPTDADKKKLSDEIQKHYKPGPGKSNVPSGATRMDSGTNTCTQSTAQIAACSGACSASCILKCNPVTGSFPWSSDCKS